MVYLIFYFVQAEKVRKLILLLTLIAGAGWGSWYYFYVYKANFSVVIPGEMYRSGQMGPEQLEKIIREFEIQSIINLRGFKENEDWYRQEKEIAEKSGVNLYNLTEMGIELQSYRLPAPEELEKIIKIIDSIPRPVLVHCKKGADRTGLFSAITVLLGKNSNLEQAWDHSSLKYLAIPESAGSQFLQKYQDWLGERKHHPRLLAQWLGQVYIPHYYWVRIKAIAPPEVVESGEPAVFRVRVTNESEEVIPFRTESAGGVRLQGHFYKLENQKLSEHKVLQGRSVNLDLDPGNSTELELEIPPDLQQGKYVLTFDLIDEFAWFNAKGSPTETIEFYIKG